MGTAPLGFEYVADFRSIEEQSVLLRDVMALCYQHDTFRGQKLKRGYAQFGYTYVSIGRRLEATAAIPDFVRALIHKMSSYCPAATTFNQCIITHYPTGSGIGWHTDAPGFGEYIVGVSLGAEARLQFRPNGAEEASFEVRAAPGSMYLMHGAARWEYQHQVLAVKKERFSLTFRQVPVKASGND